MKLLPTVGISHIKGSDKAAAPDARAIFSTSTIAVESPESKPSTGTSISANRQPSRANSRAMALPSPLAAPVTTAVPEMRL